MRLVGRRQAIIAAILRLTISEQGWECQVYRRECRWTASSLTCVVQLASAGVLPTCHKHRSARARRSRGSLRERSDVVDGHRSLLPSPRLSCRLAQELAS